MFGTKKKQRKPMLVPVVDPVDGEGNEDEDLTTIRRTAPPTKKKSTTALKVAFNDDDEEEQETSFKIKRSSASRRMDRGKPPKLPNLNDGDAQQPLPTAVDSGRSYDAESLRQMARSQARLPIRAEENTTETDGFGMEGFIPDDSQILALKRHREKLRNQSTHKQGNEDFISFTKPSKYESRLVTEDQEIDGEEAFEDHEGDKISFGTSALKKSIQDRSQTIRNAIDEINEDFTADNEEIDWEMAQVRRTVSINQPETTIKDFDGQIPDLVSLPSFEELFKEFDISISNIEALQTERENALNYCSSVIKKASENQQQFNLNISTVSVRYGFFQDMLTLTNSLSALQLDKIPTVESLQTDFICLHQRINEHLFQKDLDGIHKLVGEFMFLNVDSLRDGSSEQLMSDNVSNEVAEIEQRKSLLFTDVSKDYRSYKKLLQSFDQWRTQYESDFHRTYTALSLPAVVSLHIKKEIIGSNPFSKIKIEDFKFHQTLCSEELNDLTFNSDDTPLLTRIVEKLYVPYVEKFVPSLNILSATHMDGCLFCLQDIDNYIDKSTKSFTAYLEPDFIQHVMIDLFLMEYLIPGLAIMKYCNPEDITLLEEILDVIPTNVPGLNLRRLQNVVKEFFALPNCPKNREWQ
ncbi:GC-rich sequence DNA-binding factor 2, partial [Chytridiales sp. JEL 0842]